jgi:hypothetical protein
LHKLSLLFLTNNTLTGNLYDIFDPNYQNNLTNIDLVNNLFSGSIPSAIFSLSSLEMFAASNNCMSGSLPIEICSSTRLVSLILDGIHSNCRNPIFPLFPFIKTYSSSSSIIEGGIPTCVFNMISLNTLHIAGNSIKGTLDKDIVLNNKLTNLDVSNNVYSGEIPIVIQKYQWQYLNLGHNKFKDTLDNSFPKATAFNSTEVFSILYSIIKPVQSSNSSTLILNNNRISGFVPSSLESFDNINILRGNIFSCFSKLPSHDPLSSDYQCGSNYLYMFVLSFIFIMSVVILIKLRFYRDDDNILQSELYKNINRLRIAGQEMQNLSFIMNLSSLDTDNSQIKEENSFSIEEVDFTRISNDLSYEQDSNITLLLIISENLQQCLIYIVIFIFCFWLLTSIILHQYYSTYDFMYGYNLSMTFLSGYPAAIVLILLITLSIVYIYRLINEIVFQSIDKKLVEKVDDKKSTMRHFWLFLLVFIINLIVMIAVNGLYVIASLNPEKYKNVGFFSILLTVFKTVWESFVLPFLLALLITNEGDEKMIKSNSDNYLKFNIIFQCSIGILNAIIFPLFITSFLSSNCFYFALIPQEDIISSYLYQQCVRQIEGVCVEYTAYTRSSSYSPSFQYSYQCANTLMTIYDSVYITMSIILMLQSLLVPFIKVLYRTLNKYSKIENMISAFLPFQLKPLQRSLENSIDKEEKKEERMEKIKEILFIDQRQYIFNIVLFMSLSVSIGLILPLVGVIICISLYLYIHSTLSNIGGKLNNSTKEFKEILENECENFVDNLKYSLNRFIYIIMVAFFSLFVFDIVGDVSGSDVACWYVILTLLIPFILWAIKRAYTLYYNMKVDIKSNVQQEGISLQDITEHVNNPLNYNDNNNKVNL